MGMQYISGIDFKYNEDFDFSDNLYIPSDCSFSQGQSLQTSDRYSKDYSKKSQSITRCIRTQAKTYTISYRLYYPDTVDLFSALSYAEDCIGRTGHLYYSGLDMGLVLVQGGSFTLETDSSSILYAINISLNIVSAMQPKKPAPRVKVETQYKEQK